MTIFGMPPDDPAFAGIPEDALNVESRVGLPRDEQSEDEADA